MNVNPVLPKRLPPETHRFNHVAIALVCSVVAIVLLGLTLLSDDIWLDEACSLYLAKFHSFSEIAKVTAADVHPPLYYWILHLAFLSFPNTILVGKLVSAIPIVLLVYAGIVFLRRIHSPSAILPFVLLCLASGMLLESARDIRMYSWAALFVTLAGMSCRDILVQNRVRDYVLCGIWVSAASYTHYFAALAGAILCLLTSIAALSLHKGRRLRTFGLLCSVAGIAFFLYLPWLKLLLTQLSSVNNGHFWVKQVPSIRLIPLFVIRLFDCGPRPLAFGLAFLSFLCFVTTARACRSDRLNPEAAALFVFAATPPILVLVTCLYSRWVSPVFTLRYAIPVIPLLLLFSSMAISRALPVQALRWVVAVFAMAACLTCVKAANDQWKDRKAWKEFVAAVSPRAGTETQFVYFGNAMHPRGILTFLFPDNPHCLPPSMLKSAIFRKRVNWIPLDSIDWNRPWTAIETETKDDLPKPAVLENRPCKTVRPSCTHYKSPWIVVRSDETFQINE